MLFRPIDKKHKLINATMFVALFLYAIGGPDVLLLMRTSHAAPRAEGYSTYGKELRTAEFVLGGGTDHVAHASDETSYSSADGTWPTSKPSVANADVIKLDGLGLHVVSAQLELSYDITGMTGAGAHVTDNRVTLDVQGTSGAGSDIPANDESSLTAGADAPLLAVSSAVSYGHFNYDVSGFFSPVSSADLRTGIAVILGLKTTFYGTADRSFTSAKLVLTYETTAADGNDANYASVKTIRLPLDSMSGTDSGSMQSGCAASASCAFQFDTRELPDLTDNADILSAHVELGGRVNGASVLSFATQLNSGATSPTFTEETTAAGGQHAFRVFAKLSPSEFSSSPGAQTFTVSNGASSQTLSVLGGEVVVTYRFKTSAPQQAETVRYYVGQGATAPGVSLSSLGSVAVSIDNAGATVKRAWVRAYTAPSNSAVTLTLTTQVATANARAKAYVFAGGQRAGASPMLVQDLTQDISSFSSTSTAVAVTYRYSLTGNAPIGAEVVATFVWNGDVSSTRTKSVTYAASQRAVAPSSPGVSAMRAVPVWFPEEGAKTVLSAYVDTRASQSVTSGYITSSAKITYVYGTSYSVADGSNQAWPSTVGILTPVSVANFSASMPFTAQRFSIGLNQMLAQSNFVSFANSVVVTYSAAPTATRRMERQIRTVEYELGGGTSATAFNNGATAYVGASWGTSKPAVRNIIIAGSNVRVVSAYLDTQFQIGGASPQADVQSYSLKGDATYSGGNMTDLDLTDLYGNNLLPIAGGSGSGATNGFRRQFDVTPLLSRQTSSEWNSGVGVVFGITSTLSLAMPRQLSTAKLVVTYESDADFNRIGGHDETKTVRFPLLSVLNGDVGSRSSACTAGNCDFTYDAVMEDWSGDANDLLSVSYEVSGSVAGSAVSSVTFTASSASTPPSASSAALPYTEAANDLTTPSYHWAPPVVSSGFIPNQQQTLRVNTSAATFYGLGGEVVVTYRYNSGQHVALQTETVRYPVGQVLASSASGSIGDATVTLKSPGHRVVDAWLRVQHPYIAGTTLSLSGTVGSSSAIARDYTYAPGARTYGVPTLVHDLSSAAAFMGTTTMVSASYAVSPSTGAATYLNAELYVTYQFDGSQGGPITKTTSFVATQQANRSVPNSAFGHTVPFALPGGLVNEFHSGAVEIDAIHDLAGGGNISPGTVTIFAGGGSRSISEDVGGKVYMPTFLHTLSATDLFGTSASPENESNALSFFESTTYGNRLLSSAILYLTYTEDHLMQRPSFGQGDYRIFYDDGSNPPSDPWPMGSSTADLAVDGEMTNASRPLRIGEHVRLRMDMAVSTTTLATSSFAFRLEYAPKLTSCSAISNWTPVGGPSDSGGWRGIALSPAAGTPVSGFSLPLSTAAGTVEQGGTSALNPVRVVPGGQVEYEWDIQHNGATNGISYCFRMAESDGTPFDNYTYYPVLATAPYTGETTDWQWFVDDANEATMPQLAPLDTTPFSVDQNATVQLRVGVREVAGVADTNLRFGLQYTTSADFSSDVNFVDASSSCVATSTFCYTAGSVGVDDGPLAVSYIPSATLGRHNWTTASSTWSPAAHSHYEMEYTIKVGRVRTGQVYFFRLFDLKRNVPLAVNDTHTSPSLAESANLGVSTIGVPAGVSVDGSVTTASSTADALDFGQMTFGGTSIIAQKVHIVTNAMEGYKVGLLNDSEMTDAGGDIMPSVAATNDAPRSWSASCDQGAAGCVGYHPVSALLDGGSTRFSATDTWSGLSTSTAGEIGYSALPTTLLGNDVPVVYRIEPHTGLLAGEYGTNVTYIVTPVY